ncbi:hypothetical protein LA429_03365 [Weissella cibaria]|uniref:hypothetical protein n=1 Tax=Weissella cibaria TaxID=137591 RepID=UPI001E58EB3C|nr:hypothetical protein [Weissella cibaria]MCC6121775.1 hypothetical protein [Weissella cibaria]
MKKEYKASAKLYKAGKFMMTGVVAVALMGGVTQAVVQPTVSAATKVSKSQRVKLVNTAKSAAVVATAQAKVASSAARVATADSTAASKAQSMAKSAVAIGSTAAKSASSVAVATKAVQNAKTTAQVNSANANIGVLTKYVTKAGSAVYTASTASSAATSASKQASTAARNASVAAKAVSSAAKRASSAAKRASSAAKVASSTAANTAKSTAAKANNQAKSYATVASTKYKNVGASSVAVKTSLATTKKNVSLAQSAAVATTKAANNAMSNFYDYVASAGNSNNAVQSSDTASASASSSASVAASKSASSVASSKSVSDSLSASVAASKAASTSSSAAADQLHMTDAEKLAAITSAAYAELNAYRAHYGVAPVEANARVAQEAADSVKLVQDGVITDDNPHKNFYDKFDDALAEDGDLSLMLVTEGAQRSGQLLVKEVKYAPTVADDSNKSQGVHDIVNGDNDGNNVAGDSGDVDTQMVYLKNIKTQAAVQAAAHAIIYTWGSDWGHKRSLTWLSTSDKPLQVGIALGATADGAIIAYADYADWQVW